MLRRGVAAAAGVLRGISAHTWAVPPPAVTALPVDGSDELFPVRRVFCVGRNYAAVRGARLAQPRAPVARPLPAQRR